MKKDIILTTAVRIFIMLLGFLATVVTARYLGPQGRGDYYFITTLAGLIAQFSNLGLQSSNTYFVARDRSLFGSLFANSFWVSVLIGAGSAAAIALFLRSTHAASDPVYGSYVWYAVLLAPAMLFFVLGTNLLVGVNNIGKFNAFQVLGNLLTFFLYMAAAWGKWGVQGFLAGSTAAWLATSTLLFFFLYRTSNASLGFSANTFRTGFGYASKAYLTTLLGFLILKSNVFLLRSLTDAAQVGYFSVASQLADVLGILPASAALVLFPNLVSETERSWQITVKNAVLVGAIMLAGCIIAGALFKPFVRIAFGEQYLPACPIFYCMLPGVLALSVITILSQYIAAAGFPKMLVAIWLVSFAAVSVSGWLLIPVLSGMGAAVSLSIAYGLLLVMIFLLATRLEARRKIAAMAYAAA